MTLVGNILLDIYTTNDPSATFPKLMLICFGETDERMRVLTTYYIAQPCIYVWKVDCDEGKHMDEQIYTFLYRF